MESRWIRRLLLPGCAVLAGSLFAVLPVMATEEIADQNALDCLTCHPDDEDYELLSDQGQYFRMVRSLAGFDEVLERFGECTYCHEKRAGSEKMTREGLRFLWMMEDMAGLRSWLEEVHPKAEPVTEPETDGPA